MRTIFEQVIARGDYDLTAMLQNIDRYHIEGKLTDEDRESLYALAREGAQPVYAYGVGAQITYNGQRYRCKMPNCVWSPDAYPDAWELVES